MTVTPEAPARPLRVFYWAASEEDGTVVYRVHMPGSELARLGHEVRTAMLFDREWARTGADVIVGQRICHTKPSIGWQLLCRERAATGQHGMVYEVDDDLFGIDDKTNPLGRAFQHPTVQQNLRDNVRAADVVTVTTEHLAEVIRKIRRDADRDTVVVVPNAIRAETLATVRTRPRGWSTVYGWQGSTTHAADWAVARDAVAVVLREDKAFARLHFLGTFYLDGLPRLDEPVARIKFTPWTTDIDEHYRRVADFDVSLAPLALTRFNRSKSALRVQESLALGVPVIASDVPSYRGWVEDGVTGLVVPPSTARWVEALRLMQDAGRRAEMAAAGREAAQAWTVERTIGRWVDAYRMAMEAK